MAKKRDSRLRAGDDRLHEIEASLRQAAEWCGNDLRLWRHYLNALSKPVLRALLELWHWQAHGGQREPRFADKGGPWTVWMLMAGRGFGKTRAGAEWVWQRVRETPGARIALVGGSMDEAAKVMVEGPSGLLRLAHGGEEPRWSPTKGTLSFGGGAQAFVYSAAAPEALRGPEHHFAWADELAKWPRGRADHAWDNLMMGLRLGERPRVVVTTTPRPVALLKRVMALDGAAVTHGRTEENPHLPDAFVSWVEATYGGTRLGRQELGGELIEDVDGALFPRGVLEGARVTPLRPLTLPLLRSGSLPLPVGEEGLSRVVVGVDPPASAGGTCGIVVCGDSAGLLIVLADCSVSGASPERWARAVVAAAEAWGADRVIAEKNQGGDMVASVLRTADVNLPVKLVSASRGKVARAEPVAALFESGRAKLAGRFAELEDELAGLTIGGGYAGPGASPDRADAMVWAMHALMARTAQPRIRGL